MQFAACTGSEQHTISSTSPWCRSPTRTFTPSLAGCLRSTLACSHVDMQSLLDHSSTRLLQRKGRNSAHSTSFMTSSLWLCCNSSLMH